MQAPKGIISRLKSTCLLLSASSLFLLSACSDSPDIAPTIETKARPSLDSTQIKIQLEQTHQEVIEPISQVTTQLNTYFKQAIISSEMLQQTIITLAENPTNETLKSARQALSDTHSLFLGGDPLNECINNKETQGFLSIKRTLDQHPILAGYLDAVEGYPFSGLIHSDTPLTRDALLEEFQLGDPLYVTLGFHPLDVILNGSDKLRETSDFAALTSTADASSSSPELRRTIYARLLSQEILSDLMALADNWIRNVQPNLLKLDENLAGTFIDTLITCTQKKLPKFNQIETEEISNKEETNAHFTEESLQQTKLWLNEIIKLKNTQLQPEGNQ